MTALPFRSALSAACLSARQLPSSLGCRPSAPRLFTASTGVARWSRSTDRLLSISNSKAPASSGAFLCPRNGGAVKLGDAIPPLLLPSVSERATLAALARWPRGRSRTRKTHAQIASYPWPARAGHRPAVDRPGHRCDQLAAIELHDQADPVGRLRRRARRSRLDPDLAEQALIPQQTLVIIVVPANAGTHKLRLLCLCEAVVRSFHES